MNEYSFKLESDVELCEVAQISCNNWNYRYIPKTTAQLTYKSDVGIIIKLICYENNPFTRYTENYDPIYTDSCMEAFINLFPNKSKDYINIEVNSNGAYIFSFGPGRGICRTHFEPNLGISPTVKTAKTDNSWIADIIIGNNAIEAVYGKFEINSGHSFTGNFYKCGEDGDNPHFLSWNKITLPKPDFHCPSFFGKFNVL